ncbi:OmpA family protein [Streptomyces niveus]|uniref:OmpA family protein n=1 Tax=Streptomyces niveus TaxID=193462 RepID=UPI0034266056
MNTTPRSRPLRPSPGVIGIAIALAVALALVLTGCSGDSEGGASGDGTPAADSTTATGAGPDTAPEGDSDLAPAGKALATVAGDEDMVAEIVEIKRKTGFLTVRAVMKNKGDEDFLAVSWKDPTGLRPYTLAGSEFVDKKNKTRHLPWTDKVTKECVCTEQIGKIEAGESREMVVEFPDAPDDVAEVDLTLANFPPVTIPIRQGIEGAAHTRPLPLESTGPRTGFGPYDMIRRAADTVTALRASLAVDTSKPPVHELVGRIEYLGEGEAYSVSKSSVTIGLQSTLLFAKDSSELTPQAGKELGKLADELAIGKIDKPIRINGYTDNLGSSAHGLKLSRERANAIKEVMEKDRPDLTFRAKGFGERDPIADNSTEEGRERNRRAEIVFPAPGA